MRYSGINYLQSIVAFLIPVVIVRLLGEEQFGHYSYGLIFFSTLTALSGFGIDRTLVRDLVQNKVNREGILFSNIAFKIGLALLLISLVVAWVFFFEENYIRKYVVTGSTVVALFYMPSPKEWYDFSGKLHQHALLTFLERLCFLLLIITMTCVLEWRSIIGVVLLFLGVRVLFLTVEWRIIWSEVQSGLVLIKGSIKKIFQANSWIWLAVIGNLITTKYNQLFLDEKFGVEQLAHYAIALQIVQLVIVLQNQVLRLSTPYIFQQTGERNASETLHSLFKMLGLALVMTMIVVLPVYFIAPLVIEPIFHVNAESVISALNILLIWVIVYGIAIVNNQFLIGLHLQRFFFIIALATGLLSIGFAQFFVSSYGTAGAALSLLITHFLSVMCQLAVVIFALKGRIKITHS